MFEQLGQNESMAQPVSSMAMMMMMMMMLETLESGKIAK